ncbi:MAG: cytochrome P450, partial [Streptosporangiales bacterium]|nr:cytochrome P450 [Streptosporangiales bacterium]
MTATTTITPVSWDAELGTCAISGFDEASAVLRGPGWSSDPRRNPQAPPQVRDIAPSALLFMDPPDHTRLRRLLSPAFTPRSVERLRHRAGAVADAALETLGDSAGNADLLADLGYLVPLALIAELLDVGADGAELLRAETPRLVRLLEVAATAEDLAEAADAAGALAVFLTPIISERSRHPGDDFISALLSVEDISREEVIATTITLLAAGHETTANLIANGALALLRHPDQRPALHADPGRAVEELLRTEGPVRLAARTAIIPHRLGGYEIAEGQQVIIRIREANRDPRRFTDPDRIDLTRE